MGEDTAIVPRVPERGSVGGQDQDDGRHGEDRHQRGQGDDDTAVQGSEVAAVDRTVAQSGAAPTVTIREPTLVVSQATATNPGLGVDQGDTVEYDITISNGNAATDFNAFDIGFLDALPAAERSGASPEAAESAALQ